MRLSRREVLTGIGATLAGVARAAEPRLEAKRLAEAGAAGFNGVSPGPVLRLTEGATLPLQVANSLDVPLGLAVLGGRAPQTAASFFAPPLAPGAERALSWRSDPGIALYEAYAGPEASEQLQSGLFGALVIAEAEAPAVDLDDVVVLSGAAGKPLLYNGASAPLPIEAPQGGRVRLRLANASPDRMLSLKLVGAKVFIVAMDGQPSELFNPRDYGFPLCPSSRIEMMFDLDEPAELRVVGEEADVVIKWRIAGSPASAKPPIAALPPNPRLPTKIALERARQVRVEIGGDATRFRISGSAADRPLFKVAKGAPVSLSLVNRTAEAQTLRLEGHVARQLHALDDGWDPYWRDALYIAAGKTLHAAFVADNPGRWPLASTSPERRAKGLAAWFEVT